MLVFGLVYARPGLSWPGPVLAWVELGPGLPLYAWALGPNCNQSPT